jgi:hypothetical protein
MTLPLTELKRFFTEAFEYKNDYGQFLLAVDEKQYKDLKKAVLKHIEEIEAACEPEPVVPPEPKPEPRYSDFKGHRKQR